MEDAGSFDHPEVIATLLSAVAAGTDEAEITRLIRPFHPRRNTFPAEVLFAIAVAALDKVDASATHPLDLEELLTERRKRGSSRQRDQERLRFAVHVPAAIRGGIAIDLLSETYWWESDDLWHYALISCLLYLQAASEAAAIPMSELCPKLASQLGVEIRL